MIEEGLRTCNHSAAASPPETDFCTNNERASSTRSKQLARHLCASLDAGVLSLRKVFASATRIERFAGVARVCEPIGTLQRFLSARRARAASLN